MSEHKKVYLRNTFKSGNSLAVTLPNWFIRHNKLCAGVQVGIIELDEEIIIKPVSKLDVAMMVHSAALLAPQEEDKKKEIIDSKIMLTKLRYKKRSE